MTQTLLSARALGVRIGACRAVDALDLSVEAGQFWGVLGPNGVGKTTLLKTLAGVHAPDRGQVFLGDRPIESLSRRAVARRLGMLLQNTQYAFDASCEQTALVGRHPHLTPWSREKRADRALARRALDEAGLLDLAERSCMDLSGGESRRLALATLLVQDPEVMLLDEPTNHLDPANQVAILDVLIDRIGDRKKAAVMALHEINLATCYCSHVLMLFGDGQWKAGPTEELLNEANLSRLYRCRMRLVDDG
ncbi:MAG: ABC transporter ATP-binding protein, partial [Wenzhouxiangella sp.]|nr:ABC transporter ATP-binding protein [Wenzhouxiangella sp.]